MDYKITKKESFTVLASCRTFRYEHAKQEIPAFWQEYFSSENKKYICGMFGINIDPQMGNETFEYLIADNYNPAFDIPPGLSARTIPAFTWAVFPCRGPLPKSLLNVNTKIFSEWIPVKKK